VTEPAGAYTPLVPHQRVRGWGILASAFLGSAALPLAFLIDWLRSDSYTLSFVREGLPVSDTEIHMNHTRMILWSRTAMVLAAVGMAAWLVWQYQAHRNLAALGVEGIRYRPVFSVAAWLIPGVNLVVPVLALRELWRASDPDRMGREWRRAWTTPLVWVWWVALVGGWGLVYAAVRGTFEDGTPPGRLMERNDMLGPACLVLIGAIATAIPLVNWINARLVLKEDRIRHPEWASWAGDPGSGQRDHRGSAPSSSDPRSDTSS
jgi:hypothetical protein